ncbi:MAG: hypothetical protein ABIE84_06050 [bacterium]
MVTPIHTRMGRFTNHVEILRAAGASRRTAARLASDHEISGPKSITTTATPTQTVSPAASEARQAQLVEQIGTTRTAQDLTAGLKDELAGAFGKLGKTVEED